MKAAMMETLKIVAMDVMPRAFGTIRAAITQSRTSLRFVMTVMRTPAEPVMKIVQGLVQPRYVAITMCALNLKRATTVIIGLRSVNTVVLPIVLCVVMSVRKSQAYASFVGMESFKRTMRPVTSV